MPRFQQDRMGDEVVSEYDISSQEIGDNSKRNIGEIWTQSFDLSVAQTAAIQIPVPGRSFVIYGFTTATQNTTRTRAGDVLVFAAIDAIEKPKFPLKHGRGFVGSFSKLYLTWPAQPGVSFDIVLHRSNRYPWIEDGLDLTSSVTPIVQSLAWLVAGNSNITNASFLGSTTDADIIFKRNNLEILRIKNAPVASLLATGDVYFAADTQRNIAVNGATVGNGVGLNIKGDNSAPGTFVGGPVVITSGGGGSVGLGLTAGAGGLVSLNAGAGGTAVIAGAGTNVGGAGGAANINAGNGGIANSSASNTGGAGGSVNITAGTGGTGSNVGGIAGTVVISGGNAGIGSSGISGGSVYIIGGTFAGGGFNGNVFLNANASTSRGLTAIGANTTPVSQLHIFSNANQPITLIAQAQSGQSNDIIQAREASTNLLMTLSSAGLLKIRSGLIPTGSALAPVGCSLKTNTTAVSSASTTATDLITYSLPGSTLGTNGDRMRFRCAGQFAATANTKQVKAIFGATTLLDTGALAIAAAADWCVEGEIIRTGATTQVAICSFSSSSTTLSESVTYSTPAETLGSAITFKLTGTVGGAGGADITEKFHVIEWLPSN